MAVAGKGNRERFYLTQSPRITMNRNGEEGTRDEAIKCRAFRERALVAVNRSETRAAGTFYRSKGQRMSNGLHLNSAFLSLANGSGRFLISMFTFLGIFAG